MKTILLVSLLWGSAFADKPDHKADGARAYYDVGKEKVPLPKLITPDFFEPKDVCADAKKHKRKFAIVAMKSHACDCYESCNYCLDETRNVSDPANTLLLETFATYHLRMTRNSKPEKFGEKTLDKRNQKLLASAWKVAPPWLKLQEAVFDKPYPGMLIVNVESCKAIGFVPMEKIAVSTSNDEKKAKALNREARAAHTNKTLQDALAKVKPMTDDLRKFVDDTRKGLDAKLAKLHPEQPLATYLRALDVQAEKEDKLFAESK